MDAKAISYDGKNQREEPSDIQPATEMEREYVQTKRSQSTDKSGLTEIANDAEPYYYVQILASSDKLRAGSSELKGCKDVEYYRDGGMFKYAIAAGENLDDAQKCLKKLRRQFPQCFIIKMVNGKRVDFIKP